MKQNKSRFFILLSLCLCGVLFLSGCEISSSSDVIEIPSTSGDGNAAPVVEEPVVDAEVVPQEENVVEDGTVVEEAAPAEETVENTATEETATEGATEEATTEATAEETTTEATVTEEATTEEVVTEAPPADGIYAVQSGDTLGQIAERFGVSVADIAAASGLSNLDSLDVGQELTIPDAGFAETVANSEGSGEQIHVVRTGDTMYSIGRAYGFTVQELQQYNQIANPDSLDIGQEIKIPASE